MFTGGFQILQTKKAILLAIVFVFLFFGFQVFAADCKYPGDWNKQGSCTITLIYSDTGLSNLAVCKYKIETNTGAFTDWISVPCSGEEEIIDLDTTINVGTITIGGNTKSFNSGVSAVTISTQTFDYAGNQVESTDLKVLNIDINSPVTSILCKGITCVSEYDSNVKITFSCLDSASLCDKAFYCIRPYLGAYDCVPGDEYDFSNPPTDPPQVTNEGTNYVRFYSVDNAGNLETTKTQIISIAIDHPPDCSALLLESRINILSQAINNTLHIDIHGSTDDLGIDTVRFCSDNTLNGSCNTSWSAPENWSNFNNPGEVKNWQFATPGTYEVLVELTDTGGNPPVQCVTDTTVDVNTPPVSNAGPNKNVYETEQVLLDGLSSSDAGGSISGYSWGCGAGTLNNSNIAQPTYTAPSVDANTNYACTLTVTDNDGAVDSDSMTVNVMMYECNIPKEEDTQECGSGACLGDQTRVCGVDHIWGPLSACTTRNTDCGVCCFCEDDDAPAPVYDGTQDLDCSVYDCDPLDRDCRGYDDVQYCKGINDCADANEDCTAFADEAFGTLCNDQEGTITGCVTPSSCQGTRGECDSSGTCRAADYDIACEGTVCGTKDCSGLDDYCAGNSLNTYSSCTQFCGVSTCADCSCETTVSSCGTTDCSSSVDTCAVGTESITFYDFPTNCSNPCEVGAGDDQCGICGCDPSISAYLCNDTFHNNCQNINCQATNYYCTYDDSTWQWRTSYSTENTPVKCSDGIDNDCDGYCDSTGCDGLPSDPDCNQPPSIASVFDSPDPATADVEITFTVNWTDPNSGEQVKIHICKTNVISEQACSGASWCDTASWSGTSPTNCSFTTAVGNAGSQNYYAFVCDDNNACSASVSGTFLIDATAPTLTDLKVNGISKDSTVYTNTAVTITWLATDTGGSGTDHYELWRKPDGGIWDKIVDPATSGLTNTPPSEGTWWYGIHALDNVSNCIDETGAHCGGVISDSLDPRAVVGPIKVVYSSISPSVDSNNYGSWWKTDIPVTITPSTNGGTSILETRYNWDSNPMSAACNSGGNIYSAPITLSTEGTHVLYICTRNQVGLTGTRERTYYLDKTPPTGSILINDGAEYTNDTSVGLTLTCADGLNNCSKMKFSNDGTTFSAEEDYSSSKSWTLAGGGGSKTVYGKFKDTADNWSDSFIDSIILDITPPDLNAFDVVPKDPSWVNQTNQTAVITWIVEDPSGGSGLARVEVWRAFDANDNGLLEGSEWENPGSGYISNPIQTITNSAITSFTDENILTDGIFWYGLHVVDNTGVWCDESHCLGDYGAAGPIKVLVDKTKPPKPTCTDSGNFVESVAVTCADTELGAIIRYTTDGSSPNNTSLLYTSTLTFTDTALLTVAAWDTAENRSDTPDNSYTYTIGFLPDTTITSGPPDPTNETAATFVFSDTESPTSYQCKLDAGGWVSCASPKTYSVSQGTHTFQVKAINDFGEDSTPASWSWLVDTTDPVVTIFTSDRTVLNIANPTITFNWQATDSGGSHLKQVELWRRVVSQSWPVDPITTISASGDSDSGILTDTPASDGDYEYGVHALDNVDNLGVEPATIIVTVDKTRPPVPTCSPLGGSFTDSVEVTCSSGEAGTTIRYTTNGTSPTLSSAQYTSPLTFTGTTNLTVANWDGAGNRSDTPDNTYIYTVGSLPDTTITSGPPGPTNETAAIFVFAGTASPTSYQCKLDGGAFSVCTSPKTYTVIQGPHTFQVKAMNDFGEDLTPASWSWLVDTTDPIVTSFTADRTVLNIANPMVNFSWTVTDTGGSHLSHVEVWRSNDGGGSWSQRGSNYPAPADSDGPWSSSVTDSPTIDGTYLYGVHVVDGAGNVGHEPSSVQVIVDKTRPSSQIQSPAAGAFQGDSFKVNVADLDTGGSGLGCYPCKYSVYKCTAPTSCEATLADAIRTCSGDTPYITLAANCPIEGLNTCRVIVKSTDCAGNPNSVSEGAGSIRNFSIDKTPPIVEEVYCNGDYTIPCSTAEQGVKKTFKSLVSDNVELADCSFFMRPVGGTWVSTNPSFVETICPPDHAGVCYTASVAHTFVGSGNYEMYASCWDMAAHRTDGNTIIINVEVNFPPDITAGPSFTTSPCFLPTTQSDCDVAFTVTAEDLNEDALDYSWMIFNSLSALVTTSEAREFSYHFDTAGTYSAIVTIDDGRGGILSQGVNIGVTDPTLSVELTADPNAGADSILDVDLTAVVSGTMSGTINYKFDCTDDGNWELDNIDAQTEETYTATDLCDYTALGDYTARVRAERGDGLIEDTVLISVTTNQPPVCRVSVADTAKINQWIDIGAGGSTDPEGAISTVKFCSDKNAANPNNQCDGSWTQEYGWSIPQGGWLDATSKTMKWSFAQSGVYEVWAEVKDAVNQADSCYDTITITECIPGETKTCTSVQGCSHTLICQPSGVWPACPADVCSPNSTQSCGTAGTQTCNSSCFWGGCVEPPGDCSGNPPSCSTCQHAECISSEWTCQSDSAGTDCGDCRQCNGLGSCQYSCSEICVADTCMTCSSYYDGGCGYGYCGALEEPVWSYYGSSCQYGCQVNEACEDGGGGDGDGGEPTPCVREYPEVYFSPVSKTGAAGTYLTYTVYVVNNDSLSCSASTFSLTESCPAGWSCDSTPGSLSVSPGVSGTTVFGVTSPSYPRPDRGDYGITAIAQNNAVPGYSSTGYGVYQIANTSPVARISCHPDGCSEPIDVCEGYTFTSFCLKNDSDDDDGLGDIKKSIWTITGPENPSPVTCIINPTCDLTLFDLVPGGYLFGYQAKLYVEDSFGDSSTNYKTFYIFQDIIANFDCSLTGEVDSWQNCNTIRVSEGEVVYFRDLSTASDGATLNSWEWWFGDGTPAVQYTKTPLPVSFEALDAGSGTISLRVTDTAGRTDTAAGDDYKIRVTVPLPEWRETPPF